MCSFMSSWLLSLRSRHLQREMENQTAQVGCYQQRKQKVEEDIRKNEDLLKKAHVEQKKTQVKQTFCHHECLHKEPLQFESCSSPASSSVVFQEKDRKLRVELTELQNMEEPQSEDLQPLVGGRSRALLFFTHGGHCIMLVSLSLSQEEDLEEIVGKMASQQAQCEQVRAQVAQLKANFEEAEQQYRKLKDQISTVAEEADSMKVPGP